MTGSADMILLAVITAPQGIKGEVRVKSFTGDPLAMGDYGRLLTKDGEKMRITRLRPGKGVVVAKFKGINTRDEAEALRGTELYITRDQLPQIEEDDEYYVSDLIGMTAINETGEQIGKIVDAPDFGAGSLLEVSIAGGNQVLIDFSRANVPIVDLENRLVTVILPEEVSERD